MFPGAVRAALRAESRKWLTDSCVVQRQALATDGHIGGTWAAVASGVACRMMRETQRDQRGMVALQEVERTYWKLALAFDADVRAGDRVVLGGETYEVLQVFDAETDAMFVMTRLARLA
jgi:hypothetical protein